MAGFDMDIGLALISRQLCRKNRKECSCFLESLYQEFKNDHAVTPVVENTLDNAFVKIRGKDKIMFYLELIKGRDRFPIVMEMLGKWKVDEAKQLIIGKLENDTIKTSAIRALGYYKDKGTISLIQKHFNSEYIGVRKEGKKVGN